MEGDGGPTVRFVQKQGFLPTPSHGGRPAGAGVGAVGVERFLPTPSHGGRLKAQKYVTVDEKFLPTPSHGGRQQTC